MPATIRIDFDVNAKGISEALQKELSVIQGVMSSANTAMETASNARIAKVAKNAVDAEKEVAKQVSASYKQREAEQIQIAKAFAAYEKQQAKQKAAEDKLLAKEIAEYEKEQAKEAAQAQKQAKINARAEEKAAEEAARAKRLQDEINNARSFDSLRAASEKDVAQMRAGFSAQAWGDEKKAATAIINEIGKLQEKKDQIVRVLQMENLSATEQAQIASEKKRNDIQLATMRRIALENKEIAEHGAGASVGIMGIGRNIEKNFDKAAGMAKSLQGALGVAGGFTLAGLVDSANKAKEQTEAMATVLRSANVPAEQLDASVAGLKDNMNSFADEMGLSREHAKQVAIEVVGITGLTGQAAAQASELALTYEKATGGVISAEKFTKLLNKNIGDPENAKSLQLLESKYPGIGAKIAAAATEQDKLNILQQAASPAMAQMAENASGLFDRIQVGFSSATDSVGEFIGANMDTIGAVGQTTASVLPLVAGFKQYAIAQKVTTAAQWLWNAAMNANPIGLVITAVAALVGGLILLYNNVEPVRKAIDGMVSWVVQAYKSFMSWVDSLGVVGKVLLAVIAPVTLVIEGVKALAGVLGGLFGEEEKVTDANGKLSKSNDEVASSSDRATVATISKTEADKRAAAAAALRAKYQGDVVAGLDAEGKKLGDEVNYNRTQYILADEKYQLALKDKDVSKEQLELLRKQRDMWKAAAADELEVINRRKKSAEDFDGVKKDTKKDTKELKMPEFKLPTLELPVPDTEKFEESIDAKLYQIKTLAEAEEFSLKLQQASKLIDEKTFEEKVYEIRLQALLEKKRLYNLEPDLARKVQDEITELERNRMLALAKMQADAAKAQADAAKNSMEAFKQQVSEIQNTISSYTDLIFKVLQLGNAEKKRNEQWDEQLDKELTKNDKLTQAKARLAKTDAERNKILSTGEKERERMFDANEKRQSEYKEKGSEMSEQQKVQALINASASMVVAVANIIAGLSATGPFSLALIPPAIAGALALFESTKSMLGFKDGGYVEGKGHPDGTDTVPAYLDKGEFVLNKEATAEIGKARLYAWNARKQMPKFSTGGMLEDLWDESLRIGSFANGHLQNKFTISSLSVGVDSQQLVTAMDRQTEKLTAALEKKSVVLNSQRMLLTNKMAQRSRNREIV